MLPTISQSPLTDKRAQRERLQITVQGAVQGVGFRPHVYLLAKKLELSGWVSNSSEGVHIEVEGSAERIQKFINRLVGERPAHSKINSIDSSTLPLASSSDFEIRNSDSSGDKTAIILPDIATCSHCLAEMLDSTNRRYLYPFTNCTHCGPRFSIVNELPYDRPNTTMSGFELCDECRSEYENPLDRRFHAQPIACPSCGPKLSFTLSGQGHTLKEQEALQSGVETLKSGKILALKGLGGFQLLVDARDPDAVARLRKRKRRSEKPFATLFPSLVEARKHCEISKEEARLLESQQAPIVLLERIQDSLNQVAPRNPELGIMLPYTPLHHLIAQELGFPVVATSGNLSEEPICIENQQAFDRLSNIADAFLTHDRPIARPMDDSIARIIHGQPQILRRARGYAPLPIEMASASPPLLSVGGHLKNTVAVAKNNQVFLSQHIGNVETEESYRVFKNAAKDLPHLYEINIEAVARDAHPDYQSALYAETLSVPKKVVQHHIAHLYACMAENKLKPPVLGFSWDGTGYGTDGTIWGGECFYITEASAKRVASLRPFSLPGGDLAAKEARRSALGLLHEASDAPLTRDSPILETLGFGPDELPLLLQALSKEINAPQTSSMGRLFDAISALLGFRIVSTYEGQAAMELEWAARRGSCNDCYKFQLIPPKRENQPIIIDWKPVLDEILDDIAEKIDPDEIALKFHHSLANAALKVARPFRPTQVALTGGCFQNRLLSELVVQRLEESGFTPFWHQKVPPNDGGIALGQIAATHYTALNA